MDIYVVTFRTKPDNAGKGATENYYRFSYIAGHFFGLLELVNSRQPPLTVLIERLLDEVQVGCTPEIAGAQGQQGVACWDIPEVLEVSARQVTVMEPRSLLPLEV